MCSVEVGIEYVVSAVIAARNRPSRVNYHFVTYSTDQGSMSPVPQPTPQVRQWYIELQIGRNSTSDPRSQHHARTNGHLLRSRYDHSGQSNPEVTLTSKSNHTKLAWAIPLDIRGYTASTTKHRLYTLGCVRVIVLFDTRLKYITFTKYGRWPGFHDPSNLVATKPK